jgi:murein DD-endopeptidase MepM/ murein hydrolase activator NlpD
MRARRLLALAAVPALVLGLLGPAQAADERHKKAQIDRAIHNLKGDLDETSADLRRAGAALDRAEAKLPGARARVARVHGQLVAAQERDRIIGMKLDAARAEVLDAEKQIDQTLHKIASSRQLIGRIARSSYQSGGMGELAVVLQAQTPDEFATRLVLVQNALRSEGNVLGGLAEARADLAAQRATLVAKRKVLAGMKREQEAVVARVEGLQAQALDAQHAVEQLISEREAAVATIEREKKAEEARFSQMRAESARLGRILERRHRAALRAAARRRASYSGGGGGGVLSYPVQAPITSPYGMRVHPVTGIYKLHDGTDFGVGCGTPVHAAASGTVIQAALTIGYGNQLVIDHGVMRGVGLATSYNHLMRFSVGYGSHVSRGQVIGYSGGGEGMYGAGYSTGCHLHFMVYVNGGTTNPMGWL